MSTQYPNVPALPGVPVLARLAPAPTVSAATTTPGQNAALAAALGLPAGTVFGNNALYSGLNLQPLDPSYAILDSNSNVIISPDSCVELDVNADSSINTHPIEQGQFAGYNRVQQPVAIRLLLACQGQNMSYTTFLSTLKSLREGTQVVTVSLPNDSYPNMALKGFSYKRTAEQGAVTIWADTQWQEERSTNVSISAPATSQPQGAATSNLGTVQAQTPTNGQAAAIDNPPVTAAPTPTGIYTPANQTGAVTAAQFGAAFPGQSTATVTNAQFDAAFPGAATSGGTPPSGNAQ